MSAWRSYWQWYGVGYGLFQALVVIAWVASGIGLFGGLAWMAWRP